MKTITKNCEYCKQDFEINTRRGYAYISEARFCSSACYGLNRRGYHASPNTELKKGNKLRFKDGLWSYRKHKKSECEDCGSVEHLLVHHMDENRRNNDVSNLRTVCAKCHTNIYHPRKFYGNQYV